MTQLQHLTLTILGAPRTKKNSNRLVHLRNGQQRVLPSAAWETWVEEVMKDPARCQPALPWDLTWKHKTWLRMNQRQRAQVPKPLPLMVDRRYNCRALFYRDRNAGDTVGYQQGLADLLEHVGVLSNDKWIVTWDGTRPLVDRLNPRVELVLTPLEDE